MWDSSIRGESVPDCKKRRIVVFVQRYLPGYRAGGPIRTLSNMVERLGDDFEFSVVTLDRDLGDSVPYPDVPTEQWIQVGKARVYYVRRGSFSLRDVARIVKEADPDCIYLNGFLDPVFTQRVLWARRFGLLKRVRVVLAPRGEFSAGALAIKSLKKNIYFSFVRLAGICDGLVWQASSVLERDDILKRLDFVKVRDVLIARNLAPPPRVEVKALGGRKSSALQVAFLGRISPMKNLDFALRVLAGVSVPVHFAVYGPMESVSYWKDCQEIIRSLPTNVEVSVKGRIAPEAVVEVLSEHDLFLFPTRGENYGHVIHEALAAGLPVLISDRTPWTSVQAEGVGWAFPLDAPKKFTEKIEEVALWGDDAFLEARERARGFAARVAGDEDVVEQNRSLFGERSEYSAVG